MHPIHSSHVAWSIILILSTVSAGSVSVKDYGAIGDGKADDTAAFRKAFKASHGDVFVPPGRYLIRDLNIPENTILHGAGGRSIITIPADADHALMPSSGCTVRDLKLVAHPDDKLPEPRWRVRVHSQHLACEKCGRSFDTLSPHNFSFNSSLGWCQACEGLGTQVGANPAALLRDSKLSLAEGALLVWPEVSLPVSQAMLSALSAHASVPVDVPLDHPVYNIYYPFPDGLPKIHEHDGLPAQGLGIFLDGRLVLYYSYQSDLGDGWEDPTVHGDPAELREQSIRMGINLFLYALSSTPAR